MCAYCEEAFEGRKHYEKKGLAYCERDFKNVSGEWKREALVSCLIAHCSCLVMCVSAATNLAREMVSTERVMYS